ncbi:MAG TPA: DUF1801 domain-containing protein [Thermoplasmata archaeon]|nr:DUF1801 domain-containing protein [Thermoplasmata archaeon]
MNPAKDVDAYIAAASEGVRPKLKEVRAAIREVAPDAAESMSYGMPYYSFRGESGIKGRLCYFALLKTSIGFYLRPPVIDEHIDEVAEYRSTKSALKIPLNRPIPAALIKRLVKDAMRKHEAGEDHGPGRRRKRKAGR